MKLIFASRNENKFLEIEKIIPKNIQLGNLNELNFYDEITENEETIEGNATFKAEFIHSKFGVNVFADDTAEQFDLHLSNTLYIHYNQVDCERLLKLFHTNNLI